MRTLLLLLLLLGAMACGEEDIAVDVDYPPDSPCAVCGHKLCVQYFDGTCGGGRVHCVAATRRCRAPECTAGCQAEVCVEPYTACNGIPGCGGVPEALKCYGP
ncbi:MAG: hypothetical protein KC620_20080 [Myxococcales bacterium]|nr:hypothetical protein [Myxococcales bacterium]